MEINHLGVFGSYNVSKMFLKDLDNTKKCQIFAPANGLNDCCKVCEFLKSFWIIKKNNSKSFAE